MAKIKIIGDAMVVTSALKLEGLKKLDKFRAEALTIPDEEGNSIFAISIGKNANFSKYGATFTGENADGFATTTIALPTGIDNAEKRTYVRDTYGEALLNLISFESIIEAEICQLTEELAEAEANIETEV